MPNGTPHQDGDRYELVSNLTGQSGGVHVIQNGILGQNVFLYPDCDLALLSTPAGQKQPYVALEYGDVPVGKEIGVAGYPVPKVTIVNGKPTFEGLIFRVARGVVTSTYSLNINSDQGLVLQAMPVIEVNFLFVPGNSGGPVFDSETGRVSGFVHGYTTVKIREKVESVTMINPLPTGVGTQYIENINALYSLAIKMERARHHLEGHGVSL